MPVTSIPFSWYGIALILTGAFFRALYVINNKRNLRGISPRFVIVVNMLGAGIILLAALFLTGPAPEIDWTSWPSGILWPLAATAAMNVVIQYSELKSLQLEDASLVTPMGAAAPVLSIATGFLILGEAPTVAGWFGVLFLSVGSYVLNISKPVTPEGVPLNGVGRHLHTVKNFLLPWTALVRSRGVRFALMGALVASISINFDKLVAVQTSPFFLPGIVTATVGLFMLAFLRPEHIPKKITKKEALMMCLSPILFAGALFLFVSALKLGLASYSSALRRTSILFVLLLAAPLLKERGHPERLWGGAIMTAGAILLAF